MLSIRFDDIAAENILRLVADKISEQKTLDYKQTLNIGGQDDRAEFLADVSSFANASGGDIIFGISDERDSENRPTGIPKQIVPLPISNPAAEKARIEEIVASGIQPRIPIVQVKSVDVPGHGLVMIVRIGKSWIAPHMVSYANRTRFYSRNGTGKVQLDVQQIGAAFAAQRTIGERLRLWKTERISNAVAENGPASMVGPMLLYHFIPATALASDEQPIPRVFDTKNWGATGSLLMSLRAESMRYNADGLLYLSRFNEGLHSSYLQVFRDGRLEYGDSYALLENSNGAIASMLFEPKIVETFEKALALLHLLNVPEPIYATLTLIGVKGMRMAAPYSTRTYKAESAPFDRDIILCSDVLIQNVIEGRPYPSTLRPIIDSVWQSAGYGSTPYVDSNGNWAPGMPA